MERSLCGDPPRPRMFGALRQLGERIVARHSGGRRRLDMRGFEDLSDFLTIVRPASRYGAFRFEFVGATIIELAGIGEMNKVEFLDLLDRPFFRSCLEAYRHVHRTGLPHVTRDHPRETGGYFTRLVIPIFAGNRPSLLLGAVHPHDEPAGPPGP